MLIPSRFRAATHYHTRAWQMSIDGKEYFVLLLQVRTPPGKSQVIWVSIGNKQLDPPPWKKFDPPLENDGPSLEP